MISHQKKIAKLSTFDNLVLSAIRRVPKGRVTTYISVARVIGRPRAFRAVGNALAKNQHLVVVPCHRVVCADGTLGGYVGGWQQKKKILAGEGIRFVAGNKISNFSSVRYVLKK